MMVCVWVALSEAQMMEADPYARAAFGMRSTRLNPASADVAISETIRRMISRLIADLISDSESADLGDCAPGEHRCDCAPLARAGLLFSDEMTTRG